MLARLSQALARLRAIPLAAQSAASRFTLQQVHRRLRSLAVWWWLIAIAAVDVYLAVTERWFAALGTLLLLVAIGIGVAAGYLSRRLANRDAKPF